MVQGSNVGVIPWDRKTPMASRKQYVFDKILDLSGPGTYNEETGRWSNCGKSDINVDARHRLHDETLRRFIGWAIVKDALRTHRMTPSQFDVAVHDSLDPNVDPQTETALRARMKQFLVSQGVKFVEEDSPASAGWSFFGFKSKTVEDAEEHLQRWAAAILKRDAKTSQAEQKWFNDNGWTSLEMKGSPPFYSRMVWKSAKLKKKIGVTIANGNASLDPPTNI
jgi:hypothetical protein